MVESIRPPLSKKSFPVSRVGKKKASREVGNLECKGVKVKKKEDFVEKESSSRPFLAHPAGGQETIFYLRMA